MAFTINAPKNWLLMPFFVLLVIILAPFALFFSLVRIPFAKKRVTRLNEIIASDWLPNKKYVYIGFNDDLPITEFLERDVIPKYGSHMIFDKWSTANNEWVASEPDTYHRVTAIWQDIASDFDGDPLVVVAVLTPKQTKLTESAISVYYFNDDKSDHAVLDGKKIPIEDVKKRMLDDIRSGINSWKHTEHEPV